MGCLGANLTVPLSLQGNFCGERTQRLPSGVSCLRGPCSSAYFHAVNAVGQERTSETRLEKHAWTLGAQGV